jgi:ATP-dependent DNA ligase
MAKLSVWTEKDAANSMTSYSDVATLCFVTFDLLQVNARDLRRERLRESRRLGICEE